MRITAASDSSLLISFGDAISLENHYRVISLFHAVRSWGDPRIRNLHPAYASLLIDFDPLCLSHEDLQGIVEPLLRGAASGTGKSSSAVEIPVCYEAAFAADLASVAQHCSLTAEQVIALHAAAGYFVYFLGFAPGFAYLGGLPRQLEVPRLPTPRKHVPAGSVALAGRQTGIYPNDSPGGWNLIGRTPLRMFDPSANPPSRLQPGDSVRIRRIDRNEFESIAKASAQ
ncbi:MAG TPA: 5-oxoprolinase subunit PxpB [Terriglobales bacterium]